MLDKNFNEKQEEMMGEFGELLLIRHRHNLRSGYQKDDAAAKLGSYIRATRVNASISQEDLAKKTKLSKAKVMALETGMILSDAIPNEWLEDVAEALDDNLDNFLLLLGRPIQEKDLEAKHHRGQETDSEFTVGARSEARETIPSENNMETAHHALNPKTNFGLDVDVVQGISSNIKSIDDVPCSVHWEIAYSSPVSLARQGRAVAIRQMRDGVDISLKIIVGEYASGESYYDYEFRYEIATKLKQSLRNYFEFEELKILSCLIDSITFISEMAESEKVKEYPNEYRRSPIPLTASPFIPGSSLKGVLRSYVEKLIQHDIGYKHRTYLFTRSLFHGDLNLENILVETPRSSDALVTLSACNASSPEPPAHFIGRSEFITKLKQMIVNKKHNLAIVGMGGVGKTALATAFARDYEVRKQFDGLLWINSSRVDQDISTVLPLWGTALGVSKVRLAQAEDFENKARIIREAVGTRKLLIIIDGISESDIEKVSFLKSDNSVFIVTSRESKTNFSSLANNWRALELEGLSKDESIELLSQIVPKLVSNQAELAEWIAKLVGYLPLALNLVGNALRFSSDLQDLQVKLLYLTKYQKQFSTYRMSMSEGSQLREAIYFSYKMLDESSQQVLQKMSLFAPKPNTFSEQAAIAIADASPEVLHMLIGLGLLEEDGVDRYMIHHSIAEFAGELLSDKLAYKQLVQFFVEYVVSYKRDYDLIAPDLENILTALTLARRNDMFSHFIQGVNALNHFLDYQGLYDLGERLLRDARELVEREEDTGVYDKVWTYLNLAKMAERRGKMLITEQYCLDALNAAYVAKVDLEVDRDRLYKLVAASLRRKEYQRAQEYIQEAIGIVVDESHDADLVSEWLTLESTLLQSLESLSETRGKVIASAIKPVVIENHRRGRVQTYLIRNEKRYPQDYVWLVADNYQQWYPYIHQIQIEHSQEAWKRLSEGLHRWAFKYIDARIFGNSDRVFRYATDCVDRTREVIINTSFPYDVEFESWAITILHGVCSKFFDEEGFGKTDPEDAEDLDMLLLSTLI